MNKKPYLNEPFVVLPDLVMQPSFHPANFETALHGGPSARRSFRSARLLGDGGLHFFCAGETGAFRGTISGFPAENAALAAVNFGCRRGAGLFAGMPGGRRTMNPGAQKTHPPARGMNPVAHFRRIRGKKRPSRAANRYPAAKSMNLAPQTMNPGEESRLPAPQKTHPAPRGTRPVGHGIMPFSLITPLFTHKAGGRRCANLDSFRLARRSSRRATGARTRNRQCTRGILAESTLSEYHSCMNYEHLITVEPGKRSGKPCIRGMRITVYDVLEYLASGMTEDEILADFSELTREDIKACLSFAADRERKLFNAAA